MTRRPITLAALILFCFAAASRGDTAVHPATQPAVTGPHIVLIIRHAEKPEDSGRQKSPDLSTRGFERAAALSHVIPDHFPHPDFLLATKKAPHSNRPVETIEPLAKALNEKIEAKYNDGEYAELSREVLTNPKFAGKTVLIAWHHGKIPELAHALGAAAAPDKWNPAVFNRVWEITYEQGKPSWKDLPQNALPEDSDK